MTEVRALTPKAARTRARILDAALALFRERGYEEATMRAVAERAGVSTGNAYYYFASKEHLVLAYYELSHTEHVEACRDLLARETDLSARLRGVLHTKIECVAPYHRFAGGVFGTAGSPDSPLSPFSEESRPIREAAIAFMGEVFTGSRQKVPRDLAAEMPQLLWMHLMGVILFWVHDRSGGARRTHHLIERTTDIVVRLVKLGGNPLLAPMRRATLRLMRDLADGDR